MNVSTAIAVASFDKTRDLVEVKDLIVNFEESLWQCEECNCVFDGFGDMIA